MEGEVVVEVVLEADRMFYEVEQERKILWGMLVEMVELELVAVVVGVVEEVVVAVGAAEAVGVVVVGVMEDLVEDHTPSEEPVEGQLVSHTMCAGLQAVVRFVCQIYLFHLPLQSYLGARRRRKVFSRGNSFLGERSCW